MKAFKGTTTAYAVTRIGGFMVMEVEGVMTADTVAQAREVIRAHLIMADAVKVLVDMRRAVLLIGPDGWQKVIDASISATPLSAPLGYLASPASYDALFRHCWEMAKHGRTRYVFATEEAATQWLGGVEIPHVPDFQPVSAPSPLG